MTKKILSLVLSVVMVMGLLPVMSVSAADVVVDDSFELYETNTEYNADYSATTYIDGTSSGADWKLGKNIYLKVKPMNGPDGISTNVAEITVNSCSGLSSATDGTVRMTSWLSGKEVYGTTGIFIQEMDVYITDNPISSIYLTPVFIQGNKIGFGSGIGDDTTTLRTVASGWHTVKAVTVFETEGEGSVIGYIDGECVSYKEYEIAKAFQRFQVYGKNQSGGETIIFDNIKIWSTPDPTEASSTFDDNDSVSVTTPLTVNFTERVLEYAAHSDGVISAKNNIEFVKTADSSAVAINELTLSADGKTLTIDPVSNLEKNTSYTVTVKNLHDMYGQDIASYSFEFTTADEASVEYTKVPTFTKEQLLTPGGSSAPITKLETGYINTSFTVKNTHSSKSQNVIALVFLKDNGDIKQFQFEQGNLAANGGTLTFNGGFFVNVEQFENPTIEVFVWDSLYGSMTPLVPKYTLTTTGIE